MRLWWWWRDSALIIQKKKKRKSKRSKLPSPPPYTQKPAHMIPVSGCLIVHMGTGETLLQYQPSPLSDMSQVRRQPCKLHHLSQLTFVAVRTQCNTSTLQAKGHLTHISCYLTLVHIQLLSVVCASVWRRRGNDMRDEWHNTTQGDWIQQKNMKWRYDTPIPYNDTIRLNDTIQRYDTMIRYDDTIRYDTTIWYHKQYYTTTWYDNTLLSVRTVRSTTVGLLPHTQCVSRLSQPWLVVVVPGEFTTSMHSGGTATESRHRHPRLGGNVRDVLLSYAQIWYRCWKTSQLR